MSSLLLHKLAKWSGTVIVRHLFLRVLILITMPSRAHKAEVIMTSRDITNMGQDSPSEDLHHRVQQVIDRIRPAIQADGGDVEIVEITDCGVVRIRFHGDCVGCPSSSITLQTGIEKNVRQSVPEVRAVEQVQ